MGTKYYSLDDLDIPALVVEARKGKTSTTYFVKSTISVWDKAKKRSKPSHRRTIGYIDKSSPTPGFGEIIFKEDFLQDYPNLRDVSVIRLKAHKYVYTKRTNTPIDTKAAVQAFEEAEKQAQMSGNKKPTRYETKTYTVNESLTTEAEVEIKILDKRYKDGTYQLPDYATPLSAGMDLRAMLDKPVVIAPNSTMLIRTGIAIYLNNPNLCAMILPRSGIGFWNGIVLGNLTGLIDADYQGELSVPLWNRSTESFTIKPGDRIAQMVIVPIVKTRFKVVDNFDTSIRGESGFGSTGCS